MPSLLQEKESRYHIGQKYKPVGRKHAQVCTIIDIYKTFNSKGELVQTRYVSEHEFMGQLVKNYDVIETTIARGKL